MFVPPVGVTVEHRRRGAPSGDLRNEGRRSGGDLLYLAGGLTPEADPRTAYIERIDERRKRTVVDLDLTQPAGRGLRLQSGDALRIAPIRDAYENAVRVEGHVHRPHALAWHRRHAPVGRSLPARRSCKPRADPHYVLIRRESGPDARLERAVRGPGRARSADRGGAADLALESRDRGHRI